MRIPYAKRPKCTIGRPHETKKDSIARRIRAKNKWHEESLSFRARNPLCSDPLKNHDFPVAGGSVHHVFPVDGFPKFAFNWWNFRNLCPACHNRVGRMEKNNPVGAILLFMDRAEYVKRRAEHDY